MFTTKFFKTLGPGILFATTAIGVSHLVQSTRAGAEYGFALIGFVLMANILKYPFFEYGSRYANATGKSLIYGYNKMGKGMLIVSFNYLNINVYRCSSSYICLRRSYDQSLSTFFKSFRGIYSVNGYLYGNFIKW